MSVFMERDKLMDESYKWQARHQTTEQIFHVCIGSLLFCSRLSDEIVWYKKMEGVRVTECAYICDLLLLF